MTKLTQTLISQLLHHTGHPVAEVLQSKGMNGKERLAVITSMILNPLMFAISDEQWAEVMTQSKLPCGESGCVCEVLGGPLFDALDALRKTSLWQYNLARSMKAAAGEQPQPPQQ